METIEINDEFSFPPENVWSLLTDHGKYATYAPLKESSLVKEGKIDRNGLGAQRKLVTDKIIFLEDITHFEPFLRFDYLIVDCSVPMKHYGGIIRFEKVERGTKIHWTSSYDMLGDTSPALLRAIKSSSTKMFKEILSGVKRELVKN
ncbi:MAG TPA: SRPBCC family protein [Leptospiraceae bacterium]|nr:SRPBCC family protein [Leptospiraceae bacterium]HMW04164.1 SRPBCC family protein [Leptospiraceae bacterium]HMX34667.1 SRPBCC family protein [Leptospiraceae bacterium]HMY30157.1 SRPBCC family protein [Leptospiraceae bacterium]HMZ67218.1 SRPBCC family protein [Leptospiraceae bacterium]